MTYLLAFLALLEALAGGVAVWYYRSEAQYAMGLRVALQERIGKLEAQLDVRAKMAHQEDEKNAKTAGDSGLDAAVDFLRNSLRTP